VKIPFNQQRLQSNPVEIIEAERKLGHAVSGEQLLFAVEHSIGHALQANVRDLFASFSAPAVKRRGRPRSKDRLAREDFGMEELDERYSLLLQQFQSEANDSPERPDLSPSERAYRQLASEMKDDFGNIDWRALSNKHSAWRNGRYHSPENFVDSEDFDAEIERQFPAHNN
jgi:hypothetical protein